ncbi:alpha/beta fold hydrolase [Rhodococcus sp. BP-252]|nr:alpha/beta fold hydrolase [Rhodococcus sp. BP-320]MBY6416415.1 alpha/beta fold hydrolase [Rhodococcus sp. BP-321]MBY6420779.1 alpha/beta fold hydrolase [Rhodococcus sp. BP-324]MBY6426439.1 alpha/beta fold hydrolase [Rhodococcus sp. BP-323]MBY6431438.1 alpha/beta fold hydrolase [Rhodococcus sp. BP-322]MBY6439817.1 alpha/beta fold hydrolase [Rhodococcus sp. BP-319]MBY6445659.1 alpha/beta fold hydrolase [Rhodococcus sp. BP-318]MBY6449490.1 alpha/beta fold hydrolase [Rhodococcus sp. BP-315]M
MSIRRVRAGNMSRTTASVAALSAAIMCAGMSVASAQPAEEPAPPAVVTEDGTEVVPPEGSEEERPKAEEQGIERPDISEVPSEARSTYDPESETVGYGPVQKNFIAGFLYNIVHPDVAPQGANDWNCKPTEAHPNPVVLLHGTWENAYNNFARLSPALKEAGHCVFALNYGDTDSSGLGHVKSIRGTGPVAESAKEIATYVDAVLARTGADKVDIVGHSQGGLVTRQYLRFEGGANPADPSQNKVGTVVSVAGSNHGTTLVGIGSLGRTINNLGLNVLGLVGAIAGPAASDQVIDSPLVKALDAGGDTEPGIDYTVIGTRFDEVVTPYKTTFLTAGEGATVNNVLLQDGCGVDFSDHLSISVSPRAIGIIKNALDPEGTPASAIPCGWNGPVTGG